MSGVNAPARRDNFPKPASQHARAKDESADEDSKYASSALNLQSGKAHRIHCVRSIPFVSIQSN